MPRRKWKARALLTPSDVRIIHEAAAELDASLTMKEKSIIIAGNAKGMLTSQQNIVGILRGDTWRELHPVLGKVGRPPDGLLPR